MIGALKKLFGLGPTPDLSMLLREGAVVLDVRTPAEFQRGHVKGAVNIPLDQLSSQLHRLKNKEQYVITCCASGMRSSAAKVLLFKAGYRNVVNGGSWTAVNRHSG